MAKTAYRHERNPVVYYYLEKSQRIMIHPKLTLFSFNSTSVLLNGSLELSHYLLICLYITIVM